MQFNLKRFFLKTQLFLTPLVKFITRGIYGIDLLICVLALSFFIYQFGFDVTPERLIYGDFIYRATFLFYFVRSTMSVFRDVNSRGRSILTFRVLSGFALYLLVLLVFLVNWVLTPDVYLNHLFFSVLRDIRIIYFFVAVHVLITVSRNLIALLNRKLNPGWLFVGSFMLLVFAGSGLLMLPRATYHPIGFLDALFTSVSAVCVTGLVVVDTASVFTPVGKAILLLLIEAGGIGIMTFTSFLAMFSHDKYSFQSRLTLKNMMNLDDGINHLFSSLRNVITVTFLIEGIGTVLLFYQTGGSGWRDVFDALFHSVSAFCNAGFSVYDHGLMNESVRHNYPFLLSVSALIVFGGLGFPIIFNVFTWLKYKLMNAWVFVFRRKKPFRHIPGVLNSNSVIVLTVSLTLLTGGAVFFFFAEKDHLLSGMGNAEKVITSLFMSVTPRTAGFNSFSMGGMTDLSLVVMIFLMWVGASPMSTGGGVKTTTFGIAVLNVWNTLRGRDRIEVRRRQIAQATVNRAFVIIFVSVVLLFFSILLVRSFDPGAPLLSVVFECVSAVSTVGLSLDLTPLLSDQSRIVLIFLMFTGRIGFITLLSCFISPGKFRNYQYAHEHITIN